ncbi:MAG TPA: cation:dicarboxylase symporter family transporter [Vicinamibacterales bacterium]|nr:cation:dicarboxylase symporter family transporter [Vicinamibacterales bacterium]
MSESTRVLAGLGVGLGAGLAIAASHNPSLLGAADSVAPIGTLWVNAIRMTVIPLVVSLVITGVASASSVGTVGKIGRRTILVFVAMLTGAMVLALPLGIAVFSWMSRVITVRPALPPGAAEAASSVATSATPVDFGSWLTSLVPTNPIAAAANGAMLPLVLFTLLLALAIPHAPADGRDALLRFFRGLGDTMQVLVRWIIWCAPVGIFALMLPLGAHGGAGFVGAIGFYIAAYSLASILFVLLLYPALAVFARLPMREFARAALPGQLIAFSSSSSIASLPALVRGADESLKLPKDVTGFVLPVAISMFKFAAPVSWTFGTLFVAWFYHVDLGPSAYLTIAFAAIFLAFASPGVPRGAFLMLAPMFLQIGVPVEGIGILIAVDAIPDLFATVLNATGDLAAAVFVARSNAQVGRPGL